MGPPYSKGLLEVRYLQHRLASVGNHDTLISLFHNERINSHSISLQAHFVWSFQLESTRVHNVDIFGSRDYYRNCIPQAQRRK